MCFWGGGFKSWWGGVGVGSLGEQRSTLAEYYTAWSLVKERVSKVVLICHAV